MEVTAIDGTTIELFNDAELAEALGCHGRDQAETAHRGARAHRVAPLDRRRGGGYLDGENTLADELEQSFTGGILNTADRGFFSMDRWIRFSARGAHLAWRVKKAPSPSRSRPSRRSTTDPSSCCCANRIMLGSGARARGQDPAPAPGHRARLVSFTVTAGTARRVKTSVIKVLTTLLDPQEFPAEIAALYARRWQVEIAFLHLKKTVKGTGRTLRGRSVTLARQEAWALLLIHNMTAAIAARAAGQAGIDPRLIPFTAVLA